MENKKFLVVTNHMAYECFGLEELDNKTKALEGFKIGYDVFYKLAESWVLLQVTVNDLLYAYKQGLKGDGRNA